MSDASDLGSNIEASDQAAKPKRSARRSGEERVWIQLEENEDIPPTGLPLAHNGDAFLISPGEPVEVPLRVLNVLDDAIMSVPVREPGTQRVIGHRERMRFPYRRVAAPRNVE